MSARTMDSRGRLYDASAIWESKVYMNIADENFQGIRLLPINVLKGRLKRVDVVVHYLRLRGHAETARFSRAPHFVGTN